MTRGVNPSNVQPIRLSNTDRARIAGIGLRAPHYRELLTRLPSLGFLEVHSENFFGEGGQPQAYLRRFREHYDISTHGVGLSLGSTDPLDTAHLQKLKRLVDAIDPFLVSEHLCWIGVDRRMLNDLLPLPYTDEAVQHVASRVVQVQDYLQRQILVENVSSYLRFTDSTMPEYEFVRQVAAQSGCKILLDVNNIYVNACNHGDDALAFINAIEPSSVGEIHLAGFQDTGEILIDTHGAPVCEQVWQLYQHAIARFCHVPTLIEWDTDIPALDTLLDEANTATQIASKVITQAAPK